MKDPHQNIFYYYRGPSKKVEHNKFDLQVEDNTTKSLINLLEFCYELEFDLLFKSILNKIKISQGQIISFKLQQGLESSRPDAVIKLNNKTLFIESKVAAKLDLDQIKRHLIPLAKEDVLIVITNNDSDKKEISTINDDRIKFVTWAEIYHTCEETSNKIKYIKQYSAIRKLINHFTKYLGVVTLTGFNGLNQEDFDFFIEYNKYYKAILKNKMYALAETIKKSLPEELQKYSNIKPGNIKEGERAWWAIKKPDNRKDIFNQCNFTLEINAKGLEINAVIRNGSIHDKKKPIGIFYNKIKESPEQFLTILRKIKKKSNLVISERVPLRGNKIMPGNEKWVPFFKIDITKMNSKEDVNYFLSLLSKIRLPGIHINNNIDRKNKEKLANPQLVITEIMNTVTNYKKVLDYLEKES